jgi:hypothetical protein
MVSAVRSLCAVGVSGHILIHIEYMCVVSIKQRWVYNTGVCGDAAGGMTCGVYFS